MIINKYWVLDSGLYPWEGYHYGKASKVQYNSVSIYHEPRDRYFRPIVLKDKIVTSGTNWHPKDFLRGLEKCLLVLDGNIVWESGAYAIKQLDGNTVNWGCRAFSRKQINELIELVKWHYDI